ncbi:MAG: hypothetical protein WA435_00380 [Gallionellaceae bacterium]
MNMNPITILLVFIVIIAGLAIGNWLSFYLVLPLIGAAVIIALTLKAANVWPKRNHRRGRRYFLR